MSGLQSYFSATGSYGSNLASTQSFLDNYDSREYESATRKLDEVKQKIAETREKGKALLDLGGEIQGTYVAGKGVQASIKAFRNKFGGSKEKEGDEDGDQIEDGDDEEIGADDPLDIPEEQMDTLFQAGEEPELETGEDMADVSDLPSSVELEDMAQPAEVPGTATLSSRVEPDLDADPFQPTAGQAVRPTEIGGDIGEAVGEDVGETAATTVGETAAAVGTEAAATATEAGTGALLAGAGIAAEAVPVVGALALAGVGLYDIFHHHHHKSLPPPAPAPTNTVSQKGEMVVPSFDSVTDIPASQSAF